MKEEIYNASVVSLRQFRGRYTLKLLLTDLDATITIDIHDSLCETLGVSKLSTHTLRKIFTALPRQLQVIHKDGYWAISNEGYILSRALANISILRNP